MNGPDIEVSSKRGRGIFSACSETNVLDPDPQQIKKQDPDPQQIKKQDPDPHYSDKLDPDQFADDKQKGI